MKITLQDENRPGARRCGGCTLCCKLLPMHELDKPANTRCRHQRHSGCAIYARRPASCAMWNCRWLVNDDAERLRRPDRSRYVIDIMPDYIELVDNQDTSKRTAIEVVQVWCDPNHRDAWRDPALLEWLERRGRDGIAAIVRFSADEAVTVFPPAMSTDHEWHEITNGSLRPERTPEDRFAGIARARKTTVEFS